jgi:hypothetical protein
LLPRSACKCCRNAAISAASRSGRLSWAGRRSTRLVANCSSSVRFAVGGDGAPAGVALPLQPVGEEALQQRRQVSHGRHRRHGRSGRRQGRAVPACRSGTSTSTSGRRARDRCAAAVSGRARRRHLGTSPAASKWRRSAESPPTAEAAAGTVMPADWTSAANVCEMLASNRLPRVGSARRCGPAGGTPRPRGRRPARPSRAPG